MRFSTNWALPLLAIGLLTAAWCHAANPTPADDSPPGSRGLVVHEWGTFSTFSGSDGRNLEFNPYDNDLPEFVHGYLPRNSKAGPKSGTISLETPVLYFYAERPLNASVRVDFPKGTLTEWFPHAGRTDHKLVWNDVQVLPREEVRLLSEKKESRYYAARETDAAPLRVAFYDKEEGRNATEAEKFLFYRGVGTFGMPLSVTAAGGGRFTVRWAGKGPQGDLVLLQVRAGKVRFQQFHFDPQTGGVAQCDVQIPDRDGTTAELGDAVVKLLKEKGLFDKEARAMVKTWSSAWFGEEGTRVLYVLPAGLTDELLPLQVEPKPATLLRVLVGRHDVLTPERERQIDGLVKELRRETPERDARQRAAQEELWKLGRYAGAAWSAADVRLKNNRP